jgi:predicted transcriptional regulator
MMKTEMQDLERLREMIGSDLIVHIETHRRQPVVFDLKQTILDCNLPHRKSQLFF